MLPFHNHTTRAPPQEAQESPQVVCGVNAINLLLFQINVGETIMMPSIKNEKVKLLIYLYSNDEGSKLGVGTADGIIPSVTS